MTGPVYTALRRKGAAIGSALPTTGGTEESPGPASMLLDDAKRQAIVAATQKVLTDPCMDVADLEDAFSYSHRILEARRVQMNRRK